MQVYADLPKISYSRPCHVSPADGCREVSLGAPMVLGLPWPGRHVKIAFAWSPVAGLILTFVGGGAIIGWLGPMNGREVEQ